MYKAIIIGAVLCLNLSASARTGLMAELNECKFSCTQRCMQLVKRVKNKVREVESCDFKEQRQIDRVCKNKFGHTQAARTCSKEAHNPQTVKVCVSKFGYGNQSLKCLSNTDKPEVVEACVSSFGYGQEAIKCTKFAQSPRQITRCVRRNGYGQPAINCLKKMNNQVLSF